MRAFSFLKNGGEGETLSELTQLTDIVQVYFIRPGEDEQLLRHLKLEKQYSIAKISRLTGHSFSYIQQQLRKFQIVQAQRQCDYTHRPGYQKQFPNRGKAKTSSEEGGGA